MAKKKNNSELLNLGKDIVSMGLFGTLTKKTIETKLNHVSNPSSHLVDHVSNSSSHLVNEQSPYYEDMETKRLEELASGSDAAACYVLATRYSEEKNKEQAECWYNKALSIINHLDTSVISDKENLLLWLFENDKLEKALDVCTDNTSNDPSSLIYYLEYVFLFKKTGEEKYREEAIERLKYGLKQLDGIDNAEKFKIKAFNLLSELTTDLLQKRHFLIGALIENSMDAKVRFNEVNDEVINGFDLAYEKKKVKGQAASIQDDSSEDKTDILFSSIGYNERQFIFFAKDQRALAGCYDKSIPWVFTLDKYPKEIHFPTIGHPLPNAIYIAHPAKRGLYLPIENSDEELFHDKVLDFQRLAQCLGATEITFRSIKGHSLSEDISKGVDFEIGGGYTQYEGSVGYGNKSSNGKRQSSKGEQEMVQRFNPLKAPYIPNDVAWLSVDSEWQSLVKQRLEGNMLQYSIRISSRKTMGVTDSRMDDVKVAFKSFIAKAHVNYSKQMECSFQRDEETEWEISAKFKPLEDFNYKTDNNNTNKRNSDAGIAMSQTKQSEQPLYTMNEQKYLDSLKEFLEEDAEITVHERKMLDHIRQKLNISEERAKELEMSFSTPELTEDELEYLDMYREYAAKGVVTEKERRKLDKFAIVLGIEEKRIKEIEQLSKTD